MSENVIGLSVETEGRNRGKLVVDMPPTWNATVLQLPGAKFDRHTLRITVPKTWNSLLSLKALAAKTHWKLTPDEEVKAWGREQGRAWGELARASAVVRTGDKIEGYYQHQVDGSNWLLAAPDSGVGRLLQDETGAGKTATVIRAIREGKIDLEGPILIVAVESTMETGWAKDFATWAPELRVEQVVGTIVARRKTLAKLKAGEIDVAIIGHSNLKAHTRFEAYGSSGLKKCIACGGPQLTDGAVDEKGKALPKIDPETGRKIYEISESTCQRHTKELNEIPLALVVVDEIHRAMNAQSQFTQAIWGVVNYSANGTRVPQHRRWGATGTPVSKRSDQAWAPLHWISPDGWPTKGEWVSYFCLEEIGWDGWPKVERFQQDKIEEFQQTYSAVSRRVLKEQVLQDLPPLVRWGSLERRVEMGKAQREQYLSMKNEMLIAVDAGLITAQNAATAAGRLTMLASGLGTPDPGNVPGGPQRMLMTAPSCKLDALIADFRSGEFDGQQIGMTFAHSTVLHMIRKGLIDAGVLEAKEISVIAGTMSKDEVDRSIKRFQAGATRVVMLTYAKGGTGVTLTAASTVLCVQRDWNPVANKQGIDRFHRIGSERHKVINVFDYVTKGTNEIAQLKRLDDNAETFEEIVQDRQRLTEWFS